MHGKRSSQISCSHRWAKHGQTLDFKGDGLAGRNLCTCLTHSSERDRDFLWSRAGHTVGEDVHVVPELEEVESGLQDANMRLFGHVCKSVSPTNHIHQRPCLRHEADDEVITNLDAEQDDRFEVVLLEQRSHWRYCHGECGFVICAEEEVPERRSIELGYGGAKSCRPQDTSAGSAAEVGSVFVDWRHMIVPWTHLEGSVP